MPDVLDRLEDSLRPQGAPEGPTESSAEGWSITGPETAAWASRRLAKAHHDARVIREWRDAEVEKVMNAADAEMKRVDDSREFFEHHLSAYLTTEIAAGRKTKSLDLPGGRFGLRAQQPRVEWDEESVLPWAKAGGRLEFVRVKETLDKAALKKAAILAEDGVLVIDGEVVPGAKWEPQDDSVSFAVNEGASANG